MAESSLNVPFAAAAPAPAVLRFGPFTLDAARQELRRGAGTVPLRPKTFALLALFARQPGRVLSKQDLLEAVWPDAVVTEDSLTQCIHDLRTALGSEGARLVRTVSRRGYRFDAEVVEGDESGTQQPAQAIPEPVHGPSLRRLALVVLLAAAVAAAAVQAFLAASDSPKSTPPRLSVVVLPLQIEAGSDVGPWFSDMLSDDLTMDLGKVSGLVVISRDTAFKFKGERVDPREVARELSVRFVVRGAVRRMQNNVQLKLALVDGGTGRQRWAEQFAMDRADLQQSLRQVTGVISRELGVEMYRAEGQRAAALRPQQVQADDLAMQGWSVWYSGLTRENTLEAMRLFEAAVARDPDSLRGWGGVGLMHANAVNSGWAADLRHSRARQQESLRQLERIDRNDILTYLNRIQPYYAREDFAGLLDYSQELVQRFPNNPHTHNQHAMALMLLGRFAECIAPIDQAIRLGPRDTYLTYWRWARAACLFFAQRYPEAVSEAHRSVQANTALAGPQMLLAASLARNGQLEEARKIVEQNSGRAAFQAGTMRLVLKGNEPRLAEGRQRLFSTLKELGVP